MSERVSALDGAMFDGVVSIRDQGLRGMITLRGDLDDSVLRAAVTDVTGVGFPGPREVGLAEEFGVFWMSPDELLLLVPYGDVSKTIATIEARLGGSHALLADVSDARASFTLTGQGGAIRDVLAKLTPADLHPDALPVGEVRRTRMSQVAAAFWFRNDDQAELICFRSVSEYTFRLLCNAAAPGSEVSHFK